MARTKDMTAGNPVKLILVFALPILAGNMLQQLYSLVDSLIIGQLLGVTALTAVSASGWLDWAVLSVPMGLAQGYSIQAAQCYGGKRFDELKRTVAQSYLVSVVMTVIGKSAFIIWSKNLPLLPSLLTFVSDLFRDTIILSHYLKHILS